MPTVQFMRQCKQCAKATMHVQQKPSHLLHLFLSVITVGLWIIVWALITLMTPRAQCTVCGRSIGLFEFT